MAAVREVQLAVPSHIVVDRVFRLAKEKGWSILPMENEWVRIRTKASLLSWGEEILVHVGSQGALTLVHIESTPLAQIVDWGRSQKNVDYLAAQLSTVTH